MTIFRYPLLSTQCVSDIMLIILQMLSDQNLKGILSNRPIIYLKMIGKKLREIKQHVPEHSVHPTHYNSELSLSEIKSSTSPMF